MNVYIEKLKNYPIGFCGTALALLTISNCWVINNINFLKPVSVIFGIIAVLLIILKAIIYPKKVLEELKNPVSCSFYPTIDMTTFLIAAYFLKNIPRIAMIIWFLSIIFHYAIVLFYTIERARKFTFKDVFPSWNIVYVGMVTGAIASKGMGHPELAKALVIFGTICYIVLLPFMYYVIFGKKVEHHKLPTIAILAAPASLNLAGCLTVYKNPNIYLIWFLIITSLFNLLIVYFYIYKFTREKYATNYATFTFPLAVSALAAYKTTKFFHKNPALAHTFHIIANVEILIATTIIIYVVYIFICQFLSISSAKA